MRKYIYILMCFIFLLSITSGCLSNKNVDPRKRVLLDYLIYAQYDEAIEKAKVLYEGEDTAFKEAVDWINRVREEDKDLVGKSKELEKELEEARSSLGNSLDKYMEINNINLVAKDVQYDMANKINKNFAIAGTAELDDYYNYGFDSDMEKDYFVTRVTPDAGSYSEGWYLYFHRESFKELFDELKKSDVDIIAIAEIPDYRFEKRQGNMAIVKQARW